MEISTQYNKIGKDYLKYNKEYFNSKKDKGREYIQRNLPKKLDDKKILDLGCGGGEDLSLLGKKIGNSLYGIDSSSYMIEEAKKKVSFPKKLFLASIENTPFQDNFFDYIIGRFSFHYLEDLDKGYEELSRILKPGALLILVVHHPFQSFSLKKEKKNYNTQEHIEVGLYENKVKIRVPTHTFQEYFSSYFFKNFSLEEVYEESIPELNSPLPGLLGIRARKK